MGEHTITFRERRSAPIREWAVRVGTMQEARASALSIKRELIAEGYKHPQVYVDGKRVNGTEN